jgi:hypothetical protein
MWFLTDAGDQSIRRLAAYPDERKRSRPRAVLEHDKRTLDMIVTIIELARRTGLSGIKVFREVKLNPDPKVRRPILDALVIFEVGGSFSEEHPDLVPWSLDKPLTDESLWRVCLEADNNTEANQVIAGKAISYQQVLNNQAWSLAAMGDVGCANRAAGRQHCRPLGAHMEQRPVVGCHRRRTPGQLLDTALQPREPARSTNRLSGARCCLQPGHIHCHSAPE